MMLLNAIIGLTVLGAGLSATISSKEASMKVGAKQNFLSDYVTAAMKSDRFVAVGSSASKALEGTVYSLTGSVYQNLYFLTSGADDNTCSSLGKVFGYPVNRCVVDTGFAFKLQLTGDSCTGLVIQYFSDMSCFNYIGLSEGDDLQEGQCRVSGKADDPPGSYKKMECTTSATVPLIAGGVGAEFFNSADCTGTTALTTFASLASDKCLPTYDSASGNFTYSTFSCDGGDLTIYDYETSTCTGNNVNGTIAYMCDASNEGDDDGTDDGDDDVLHPPPSASTTAFPTSVTYVTSSNIFCPANAPTRMPIGAPTQFPTSATGQAVSFDIKQQLNGVAAATVMGSTTNLDVLKATIANTMTGVSASNILNFLAEDYTTTRRLAANFAAKPAATLFATGNSNIVRLTYTVSVTSVYSKTQLLAQLEYAVYSGAFTTDLNTNAQGSTATDLYDCSSPNVIEPIDLDIDVDDSLSAGAIAGIVIGSVVFVLLVGAIVYYCFCRRPSAPMSTHGGAAAGGKGVEL